MKYLILMIGACVVLCSCTPPPVYNTYQYRVYQPSSSSRSTPSKVGGGGTRNVGGYDSPEGFRATTR